MRGSLRVIVPALAAATICAEPARAQNSPPPSRTFGPDTTATGGLFSGAEPTGLTCTPSTAPMKCSGYLASDDGTRLDVTVTVPAGSGLHPLVVYLRAEMLAHRVQLDVRLFDVKRDGTRHLVTRGTTTLDTGTPLIPFGTKPVTIPTYGNLWQVDAGDRIQLEITNVDSPYISPSRVPSVTRIDRVKLDVPIR